ncbi:ferric reductase like transmembrane component-domain-containing protein [Aspergillus pseudonomiae]|uniref:ferric-chelate reductase (NADPH) n=1 Tax=Aspergillus pseudonomiae TaxID=1506151 RepID=A0A5N6IDR4_9EURO|nr:ferric reductase like transmembrane component-domain-containing protein [Aspergillus pseudonomiae]KAB8264247.1 ferric reductase like transmembrane component-domain-containing protein [Aspergillus pseudonomiae]KAE8405533.1 ferric reductase like transmembrane component-domain-containing protein [Aspergillus pseudonomiae]
MLSPRHAHDIPDSGPGVEHHWGYYNRQLPCTSGEGKCAYLDTVYHSHDLSILYSAILWAVILGIVFLCFIGHYCNPITRKSTSSCIQKEGEHENRSQSSMYRMSRSLGSIYHRYFVQESLTPLFGRTTRFNILVLAILAGYLIIFSFVGIVYKTWYIPVKGTNLRSTPTGIGPWADRLGVLAYALTPLAVLLCTRESLLSLCTGIPYHHFNFLHRWLGWIIYIQSALHTFGWTLMEGKLYQPQPSTWNAFIAQEYMIWGIVAMIFLSFLVFFSTKWAIRLTGYEFFRKAHYVVAMLYVGACWGHWEQLSCWMIASLVVWLLDRAIRLLRTFFTHFGPHTSETFSFWGLHIPKARIVSFPNDEDGDVVRLDFDHEHSPWEIGQHFYLCFPGLSIWQSHPMTPSSVPGGSKQSHTYIIRAKKGLTQDLARIARQPQGSNWDEPPSTSIVLSGPYGQSIVDNDLHCSDDINLFCVAGGTGVTFVLPILQAIVLNRFFSTRRSIVELVWIVRRKSDMRWLSEELEVLRTAAQACTHFRIRVYVTREDDRANIRNSFTPAYITDSEIKRPLSTVAHDAPLSDNPFSVHCLRPGNSGTSVHPDVPADLTGFVQRTVQGPTRVIASGPAGLISSLRTTVAALNDPGRVWKGNERYDVELVHDDRLEY